MKWSELFEKTKEIVPIRDFRKMRASSSEAFLNEIRVNGSPISHEDHLREFKVVDVEDGGEFYQVFLYTWYSHPVAALYTQATTEDLIEEERFIFRRILFEDVVKYIESLYPEKESPFLADRTSLDSSVPPIPYLQ